MRPVRTPARAEIVGSLLRPPAVRAVIDRLYAPGHVAIEAAERAKGIEELHAVADAEIRRVVQRQIDIGLDVVSDGELRRYMFLNAFFDAVEGCSSDKAQTTFRDDQGSTVRWNIQTIDDRLTVVDSPGAREARFLASLTDVPFKVCFPAGSWFAMPYNIRPGINDHVFADIDALTQHAIDVETRLVADTIAAGASYIQFDFPSYPFLCDPFWSERMRRAGFDLEATLERFVRADQAVLTSIPEHVTVGLHLCRGNNQSHYVAAGSIAPVAERLFSDLDYDVFLMEWDDEQRMGDVSPIRFVPPGKVLVLGLISTKTAALEDPDDLVRRIEHATQYLPLEQLAISPQCGFASTMHGNRLTEDDQWRKLELVVEVANRLWR
jgi:5-methyltetrahydropteroyltriglutamate--homocysteine methyltransferase